jgi:hypothetical protein
MNRVRVELVPAIGRSLVGIGVSALFGGAHGLRRLVEGFVWGDDRYCRGNHSRYCGGCPQVHHHYRHTCQPRCYDCRG